MAKSKIFIVEDDIMYSKLIRHKLSMDPDFEVTIFNDAQSFLKNVNELPSVVTLDFELPDISGIEVLKKVKKEYPQIQFIILSAQENIDLAVQMIQNGAYDYITKDVSSMDKLWHTVHKANERSEMQQEIQVLASEVSLKFNYQSYIKGTSTSMQRVFSLLEKTAKTNITVTITGSTGTGKELVAKAVHFNSNRMKKPFIAINVAAIPKELIESEMFGYEKGAFTGADQFKKGKIEEADQGTLFLDEIGEMDLNMQAKLLRVLQERELSRLGSNKVIPIDVRIVCATHRDLMLEVKEGRFREDLYYRLLGLTIDLPNLYERGNDIIILAKHFCDDFCSNNQLSKKEFSSATVEKLMSYHYPGNVRELKAIVEIAVVMSDGKIIEPEDIRFTQSNSIEDLVHKEMTLDEYSAKIINWYLDKYNNNVVKVSAKLGVGKSTIYRMIKEGKL